MVSSASLHSNLEIIDICLACNLTEMQLQRRIGLMWNRDVAVNSYDHAFTLPIDHRVGDVLDDPIQIANAIGIYTANRYYAENRLDEFLEIARIRREHGKNLYATHQSSADIIREKIIAKREQRKNDFLGNLWEWQKKAIDID